MFGSYRKFGQTEIVFSVDHKIRLMGRKSISVFILPSNHFRKERKRERERIHRHSLRERERERRTHRHSPNPRYSDEITPLSSRRRSLSFSIFLSLLNRNPLNTTTAESDFRQQVPTLKIQSDKDVYHLGNPLIVTIQISNPDTASSLLLDRIDFEIRAVGKLDSQWFATHKPLPGVRRSAFSPITLSPIFLISLISNFVVVVVVWVVAF